MPVVPRCPRCQGILAGTGQRERCLRCGEMVVAVLRKLCSRCGRDVSASPRTKDAAGEYFCQPCWLEVCAAQEKEPAYPCGECGGLFAADQVFAEKTQYVCKGCFATRATDPGGAAIAVLSGLAAAEQSPDAALGYVPSFYAATATAQIEERAKRTRLVLVLAVVGATVLIVGLTVLMVWARG